MKKIISVLLCSILVLSAVSAKQIKYKNFIYEMSDTEISLVKYVGNDKEIEIPKSLNKIPVVRIENNAFENNKSIEVITLSRNITTIGQKAFLNCENLKEIRFFGDSLCFQKDAFLGCNEVKVLKISKEIKKETAKKEETVEKKEVAENTDSADKAKKEVIENTNSTDKAKKENIVTTELKKDQKTVTITDEQKAEVEKRRKNLISSALNLTEKLEAIETNFWIIADENYTTQIFMAATTFSSNGENFIATIKEVFGEDELKNHNSVSIWFPEDDEKTFFSYLKRLDSSYKFLNGEKGNFEENFRSILGF